MTDYEEALDDFPTENQNKTAEAMVGAFRAESIDQWTAASGISSKIPPFFDGLLSRFKYEELFDDELDLTVLEVSKRGPALKNRLISELQKNYGGLLNQESLRADDGVKYFRDSLRPISSRELRVFSFGDFICLFEQGEETLKWSIGSASFLCA